jgi:hypothetical protein
MHKNIRAAVIGRDKAISAIWVEEFDLLPEELYPKSGLAAGRLIHCFDRISADGLDRLCHGPG